MPDYASDYDHTVLMAALSRVATHRANVFLQSRCLEFGAKRK